MSVLESSEVRISDIVSFLYDPLQYHAFRLFGKDYERKTEKDTFEDLEFDAISKAAIKKVLLKKAIEMKPIDTAVCSTKLKDGINEFEGLIPYRHIIDEPYWTQGVRKIIDDDVVPILDGMKSNISEELDIATDGCPENLMVSGYKITGEYSWYNKKWSEKGLKAYSPSKTKKHLNSYVTALCLIAEHRGESDIPISLFYGGFESEKDSIVNPVFKLNKNKAEKLLEKIISNMAGFMKCVPYDIVSKGTAIKSLDELYGKLLERNGPWAYFDFKNMFAAEDLGHADGDGFEPTQTQERCRVADLGHADGDGFEGKWENALKIYKSFFPDGYFKEKEKEAGK